MLFVKENNLNKSPWSVVAAKLVKVSYMSCVVSHFYRPPYNLCFYYLFQRLLFEFFLSIASHSVYALSFFWYGILGFLITYIIGYLASFIFSKYICAGVLCIW